MFENYKIGKIGSFSNYIGQSANQISASTVQQAPDKIPPPASYTPPADTFFVNSIQKASNSFQVATNSVKSFAETILGTPEIIPVESEAKSSLKIVNLPQDIFASQTTLVGSANNRVQLPIMVSSSNSQRLLQTLSNEEKEPLGRLPRHVQEKILHLNTPIDELSPELIRKNLMWNIKSSILEMTKGATIHFEEADQGKWDVKGLLDIANAVNKLPLAHKKQLDGLTFVKDDFPDEWQHASSEANLFQNLVLSAIAGHYDTTKKAVVIYDQTQQELVPSLNNELSASLSALQLGSRSEILDLQRLLNPFLKGLGHPSIVENGVMTVGTKKAIRTLQANVMAEYLEDNFYLSPAQKSQLRQLSTKIRQGHFKNEIGLARLKEALQNVTNIIPEELNQLLSEMAKSEMGESSLRFFLSDLSNAFRDSKGVTRTEEILVHEIGHHIQLGVDNELQYIKEFGKLSQWYEVNDGTVADGSVNGFYTPEDLDDIYNNLVADGKLDEGTYKHLKNDNFVTLYSSSSDPMEDFAESYKTFLLKPEKLMSVAPEKFFFINSMPTIQKRQIGIGLQERSHYLTEDVKTIVFNALQLQRGYPPTDDDVDEYITDTFKKMFNTDTAAPAFALEPETSVAIYETHAETLKSVGFSHMSIDQLIRMSSKDSDYQALQIIHEKTQLLLEKDLDDYVSARQFFQKFSQPGGAEEVLGKKVVDNLSPELKNNLDDPSFSAMMLALGKISGYGYAINRARTDESYDKQAYESSDRYFDNIMNNPSSLFSLEVFSHAASKIQSFGSKIYNPEKNEIDRANQFFKTLNEKPAKALPEVWDQLPNEFRKRLLNERFINSISGSQGRILPSPEAIKSSLRNVLEVIEIQKAIDSL